MKPLAAVLACVVALATASQLPELYKIQKHHFTGPYGCVSGYEGSALFLTDEQRRLNSPALLYYGNCPPQPTVFEVSTAGAQMGFAVNAGKEYTLTNLTANQGIYLPGYESSPAAVEGATYVGLLARSDLRANIAWTVTALDATSGAMDIAYSVLLFQELEVTRESPGFGWQNKSQA